MWCSSAQAKVWQFPHHMFLMNNIHFFENIQVEVFEFNGQILFNPKHVAECLDIKNINENLRSFNEKQVIKLNNSKISTADFRKLHNTGENFLTESGVYKIIFQSRKSEAEKFQNWVTDEVLPSIRKHGAYMTDDTLEKALTSPDFLISLATKLKEEQQKRIEAENQLQIQKPKVIFADAVSASNTSILVGDLAKILKQNNINVGANRLFECLRVNGYLIKRNGADYNMPTQKSMELKLFEIKETSVTHASGHIIINKTPKVTGVGQQYFINKFLSGAIVI